MIEVGFLPPFKVVNNTKVDTPFSTLTLEDRELIDLNARKETNFSVIRSNDYMHVFNYKLEK